VAYPYSPLDDGYWVGFETSMREEFNERATAKEGQFAKEISSGVTVQESESGVHAQEIA
jgi:hypothetical protein